MVAPVRRYLRVHRYAKGSGVLALLVEASLVDRVAGLCRCWNVFREGTCLGPDRDFRSVMEVVRGRSVSARRLLRQVWQSMGRL
jgi:hypothetical protein